MTQSITEVQADVSLVTDLNRIPSPRPGAVPAPADEPRLVGSRFLIHKQDPSVSTLGVRTLFHPGTILNGPRDARIGTQLAGVTPVPRNAQADFIFPVGSQQFDCAHTWAVVRDTLTMVERLRGRSVPWAWNAAGDTSGITVFPHAGETANAYYSRTAKALKFFYFTPQGATNPVFTCRSLDIVAHETGHAVLDGLKPGWLSAFAPPQTGGLHESFGDLTAVFLALSQLDQADAVVALSKANLHAKTFLSSVAEEFGTALGLSFGLRNADNDLKLSDVSNEVHAISQVFTGGVYDVLADIFAFEYRKQRHRKSPSLVLVQVSRRLFALLLDALVAAPAMNATYADVVNRMLALSQQGGEPPIYRTFIRNRFTLREVLQPTSAMADLRAGTMRLDDEELADGGDVTQVAAVEHPASLEGPQDRSGCCGSMQLPEFRVIDPERLATGESVDDAGLLAEEYALLARDFS